MVLCNGPVVTSLLPFRGRAPKQESGCVGSSPRLSLTFHDLIEWLTLSQLSLLIVGPVLMTWTCLKGFHFKEVLKPSSWIQHASQRPLAFLKSNDQYSCRIPTLSQEGTTTQSTDCYHMLKSISMLNFSPNHKSIPKSHTPHIIYIYYYKIIST